MPLEKLSEAPEVPSTNIENPYTYRAGVKAPRKPEELVEVIEEATNEIAVIATLKKAVIDYLLLDDVHSYGYEDSISYYSYYPVILGRLEISLNIRKRDLENDRKALEEI